jgi:hypothetical protein
VPCLKPRPVEALASYEWVRQVAVTVCAQALVRKELGESMTAFMRVTDGTRTISAGDVVRLSTKPAALGRVKYFAVPQVCGFENGTFP